MYFSVPSAQPTQRTYSCWNILWPPSKMEPSLKELWSWDSCPWLFVLTKTLEWFRSNIIICLQLMFSLQLYFTLSMPRDHLIPWDHQVRICRGNFSCIHQKLRKMSLMVTPTFNNLVFSMLIKIICIVSSRGKIFSFTLMLFSIEIILSDIVDDDVQWRHFRPSVWKVAMHSIFLKCFINFPLFSEANLQG